MLPPPHEVGMHYIQELAVGARFGASVGGCVAHHRPTPRSTWGTHFVQGDEAEDGEKPTHRGRGATLGLGATSGLGLGNCEGGEVWGGAETHSIANAETNYRRNVLRLSRRARQRAKG